MTTYRVLLVAAALAAAVTPAKAQVAGGFPFQVAIFNVEGEPTLSGVPQGKDTLIYDLKGQYLGRVTTKAFFAGRNDYRWVASLLEVHIGCTDARSAEVAALIPNQADRTKCTVMPTSVPYEIVERQNSNFRSILSGRCLRPLRMEGACRWVYVASAFSLERYLRGD